MIPALICVALLAVSSEDVSPPTADLPRDYREARARAGRSSAEQVRLALWCEARGLARERLHHLAQAVMSDPTNATARGLLGLVAYQGRFLRPEAVADRAGADPGLAQYEARRERAAYTADAQWALGVWAHERGLKGQARAHFSAVTRLDPGRGDAWRRLGYRSREGRWVTDAQLAAEQAEAEVQDRADRKWRPILEDWRRRLARPRQHADAESGLAGVDDPRAVPSIVRVFGGVGSEQPRAVQLLGQLDGQSSSRALAILAVASPSVKVRRLATETLRGRDPREYAELLIGLLGEPIRFEVKHVAGSGSSGELLVGGTRANVRRVYTPPPVLRPDDQLGLDAAGLPIIFRHVGADSILVRLWEMELIAAKAQEGAEEPIRSGTAARLSGAEALYLLNDGRKSLEGFMTMVQTVRATPDGDALTVLQASQSFNPLPASARFLVQFDEIALVPLGQVFAEAQRSRRAAEQQLLEDVRALEDHNVAVRMANDRAAGVLNGATGQSLPPERRAWASWWLDRVGYASASPAWTSRRTVTMDVPIAYQPPILPEGAYREVTRVERRSCFGAGTPVQTVAGPRPIESLRIGDLVLTQSTASGGLGYHPILVVHRNPPSPTIRVKLGGEAVVSSHFHRFWLAGRGWVMARDLKVGETVRTLGGVAVVESVEPDAAQPVFNLDVADDADFFAGRAAALVHDNTLPDPGLVPFDAASVVVAVKPAG
jgi:Pretoxin HINT domain